MSCSKTVTVQNHAGIHCRPSALIISEVKRFAGTTLSLKTTQGVTPLNSLLALISLGLRRGDSVTLTASGPQEKEACDVIAALLENNFDFPARTED